MPTDTAHFFCAQVAEIREVLMHLPAEVAERPWRPGGWTGKQIVGHLLDSAANNRQRFVRANIDGSYTGPGYAQDAWVAAHAYERQSWPTLLQWWSVEHAILAAVVEEIPNERLDAQCVIGENAPMTLDFVIRDYIRHQLHHLDQLRTIAAAI